MALGNGNGGSGAGVRDPETDRARLRAVHAALTSGDIAAAGKLAEDALGDGIDHVMVLSLVAGRREQEGRLGEALALLAQARSAAPEAAGIANQAGLCLLRMERWEEAAAAFGEAAALDPGFAPAPANRGMALMALARFEEAWGGFTAAAALDPGNLVAANGLAALALRRGNSGEARRLARQVLAREPAFPGAVTTLAGADIAEGRLAEAEAALRPLLGDGRVDPVDRAIAWGLLGDALDGEGRFAEAFGAWRESNALQELHYRPAFGGRQGTLGLVEELTRLLEGRRIPAVWGLSRLSPAKGHVFLVGFPRSGASLVERMLDGRPDVAILAEKECLIDAARDWMGDAARFETFLDATDDVLDGYRAAYWRRVAEEGADPEGRLFVDSQAFNTFKLPLIARLFPEARVLFAGRDPRDTVLSSFRHRFRMTDPAYQLLTLDGAARLYAATMAMVAASEAAFGLFMHKVSLEAALADFEGEAKAVRDFVGIEAGGAVHAAAGSAQGVGKWRDYAAEMAPVLPLLEPFAER